MHTTLAQALWPSHSLLRHAGLVLLGSVALALLSQVEVPMLPVPMTLQTLGVLLIGFLYGSRLGAATLIAYLLEGAAGLPVFAGGAGGVQHLVGPTGGYLVGFVASAWLAGFIAERLGSSRWQEAVGALLAALAGGVVLYVPGLIWLHQFVGDWQATFTAGMVPFLLGDGVKIVLAAALFLAAREAIRRRRSS